MTAALYAPSAVATGRDGSLVEEVRSAFDYLPATLAGNVAGVAVVGLLFGAVAPASVLLPWLLGFFALLLARALLGWRFRQARRSGALPRGDSRRWRRWRLAWNAGTLASGALWGATAWLFFELGDGNQRVGLIVTVYTFCIAAVPVLATQPRVYLAFAALCFVPMMARLLLDGQHHSLELASILLLIFTLTTALARNFRTALRRVIDLKLRADVLAEGLDRERAAADAARQSAEAANRAKTQFFAAASHDLRQPLHAMGLFAEALRLRRHDEPTLSLVNSINASVHALETLFSELMDITRIDAGGVVAEPRAFAVGDLWRRLELHHRPDAFEKGLDLRFRGHQRVLHADPLLVERVLRNLLTNAIRYTDDGGVLVAARQRGTRVWLEVHDTGRGIADADRERIWEEFFQVGQAPGATPGSERRGLGLGLAIVRRLASLMDAPLALRSRPGKGSVFSIGLPSGRLAPQPSPDATAAAGSGPAPSLAGRHIVVVEDDAAVLGGLQVLLQGWGAQVQALASAAEADAWLAGASARADLALVDYRLERGRDGLQVLDAMRERLGPGLPAIVVTGSSMGRLEDEALSRGFHLLLKPVAPARLRTLVGFKLAAQAG